ILLLATASSAWFLDTFGEMDFSIVVYQLFSPMEGTSSGILNNYVEACLYPSAARALLLFLFYVFWDVVTRKVYINIDICLFKKGCGMRLTPKRAQIIKYTVLTAGIACLAGSLGNKMLAMGVPEYLKEISQNSTLFEDYYVDPDSVSIDFPENKRNLLLIYMESMESTYASIEVGGGKKYKLYS
ncbi:MAG: hypothetical protein Q4D94_13985, partial [Bacillota bacterium]|nr:hypothetical protein [Bacillota bacterium]